MEQRGCLGQRICKSKYFALALKKWVSKAIVTNQDGSVTVQETGHTGDENPEPPAKVDLGRQDINKVTVKFEFQIKITNEGEIAGYAKEVTDYIPEGLKFVQEDNQNGIQEIHWMKRKSRNKTIRKHIITTRRKRNNLNIVNMDKRTKQYGIKNKHSGNKRRLQR